MAMDHFWQHTVFYVYGLAFFSLGVVLFGITAFGYLDDAVTSRFKWLAWFGVLHGGKEFLLSLVIDAPNAGVAALMHGMEVLLGLGSYLALWWFVVEGWERWRAWGRFWVAGWLPVVVALAWEFALDGSEWYDLYLLARLVLGSGANLLVAITLFTARGFPEIPQEMARNLSGAGWFFLLYFIMIWFGPPGSHFPMNTYNEEWFLAGVGIPVQAVRAGCAVGITYFVWSSLNGFALLQKQRLLAMVEERTRALRSSEERYRNLFHHSITAIFIADATTGKLVDVNAAACKLMEMEPPELIGISQALLHPRGEEARYRELFQSVIVDCAGRFADLEIETKSGRRVPVEISASLFILGEQTLVQGTFLDISDRKAMERELREKSNYLDSILRSSTNMSIAATDLNFVIRYYNPVAERYFGYTAAEVIGCTVQQIHIKKKVDPERFDRAIAQVRATGEYLYTVERGSGEERQIIESRVSGIVNDQGELIGFVLFSRDVTTQRKAEEELRLHRDHLDQLVTRRTAELNAANQLLARQRDELRIFASIVASSSDHMSFIDSGFVYQEVNRAYLLNHQRQREQIVGHTVSELLGENTFDLIRGNLECCLAGDTVSYQGWFNFPGSGRRFMDVNYNPFLDDFGQVTGIVVISRDITERKLAEEALNESRQRFSLFMEYLPGVATIKDRLGRYQYASHGFQRLVGRPESEILGQNDTALWPPDIAFLLRAHDKLVFTTGLAQEFIELIYQYGHPTYWACQKFLLLGSDDQPLVGGIGVNVTDRILAEQQLREMAKFPNQNPYPVLRVKLDGEVLYANTQGHQLLSEWGCGAGRIDDPEWRESFARVLASGKLERIEVEMTQRKLAMVMVPFAEDGYLNMYGMDITELHLLMELLRQRQHEVEQLNLRLEERVAEEVENNRRKDFLLVHQSRLAAMGEMIGNIAHQWRQPINALTLILGNIQDAFAYGTVTPEWLEEQVGKGGRIIGRMSTTIDDFRNFFKPEKGKEPFPLVRAIEDAVSLIDASLLNHRIRLKFEPPAAATLGFGYPNEFSQVVLLILVNAKDAILERKVVAGTIEILIEDHGGQLLVSIRDNGGGISEPIRDRIFDPYFTTKEHHQGTGIGLYMAKMIIEEHMAGTILATNTADGAEFTLVIPSWRGG